MSNQGSSFTSSEFGNFLLEMNVTHIKIAAGSPHANGQVERYKRVSAPALAKLHSGKNWHKLLGEIEFAINNTVNRVTVRTPSKLLFGVEQCGRVVGTVREY